MTDLKRLSLMSVAMCAVATTAAHAQENNYYSRDKYTAVQDRSQPEFDPEPVRLGAFMVRPAAEASVSYSDNVFFSGANEESGMIARVGAEVSGDTMWSVHNLGFDVSAYRNEYVDQGDESYNDLRARLRGRVDVSRSFALGGSVFVEDRVERRTEFVNEFSPDAPIGLNIQGATVEANYQSDRFRWTNAAGIRQEDYENGREIGSGLPIDQSYRDRSVKDARTRLSYAVSPNFAVFGQATYQQSDYDTLQFIGGNLRSRDSQGYTVSGGVDFELTSLVRGDVAVGYLNETKDDSYFSDVSGLSVDGRVQWFPTQLTTVTFTGGRRVSDTGAFSAPTALDTNFGVRLDHELRRNIILSASARYNQYDFEESNRKDENTEFGVTALYKMNRRVHFNAFVSRFDRDISGAPFFVEPSIGETTAGIGVRLFP
ncbi:outer membrane beta-barrel protein [Hyphomonas sp. WL0036]|uniref:outer membrane beta-barrel protein n=1 Tax=Hyphomonas sediminis TaxID=2866160 RepID=UPI001C81A104|nr:outer membrane beta-barrel protein [Hyphomonas sediminis]MBY9067955.1 outer membrane beta-barrel protein [Hyphomonas sediminis]